MEFNRCSQVIIGGKTWHYQRIYDDKKKHEVVKLYNSDGEHVKDFLRFEDLLRYLRT